MYIYMYIYIKGPCWLARALFATYWYVCVPGWRAFALGVAILCIFIDGSIVLKIVAKQKLI